MKLNIVKGSKINGKFKKHIKKYISQMIMKLIQMKLLSKCK